MNIGIDIDDTIADTYNVIFNYAQRFTIEELKKDIIPNEKNFYTHMYIEGFHRWNKQEAEKFFTKYYKEIMLLVQPKMYASEIINKLKEDGHKIYLITARFPADNFDIKAVTKEWLKQNNIVYDELIIDANNKEKVAIEKNINIFIDDSYMQCTSVAKLGVNTFMMDYIINRNFGEDGYKRVFSWPHLYREIQKIKEEK